MRKVLGVELQSRLVDSGDESTSLTMRPTFKLGSVVTAMSLVAPRGIGSAAGGGSDVEATLALGAIAVHSQVGVTSDAELVPELVPAELVPKGGSAVVGAA